MPNIPWDSAGKTRITAPIHNYPDQPGRPSSRGCYDTTLVPSGRASVCRCLDAGLLVSPASLQLLRLFLLSIFHLPILSTDNDPASLNDSQHRSEPQPPHQPPCGGTERICTSLTSSSTLTGPNPNASPATFPTANPSPTTQPRSHVISAHPTASPTKPTRADGSSARAASKMTATQ